MIIFSDTEYWRQKIASSTPYFLIYTVPSEVGAETRVRPENPIPAFLTGAVWVRFRSGAGPSRLLPWIIRDIDMILTLVLVFDVGMVNRCLRLSEYDKCLPELIVCAGRLADISYRARSVMRIGD